MAAGREALGRRHFKTKRVKVDAWGDEAIVRGLSSAEQEIIQELAGKGVDATTKTVTNARAITALGRAAVCLGWIDEDGNQVLKWPEDAKIIAQEPSEVIEILSTTVLTLSGIKVAASGDDDSDSDVDPLGFAEKN